MLHGSPSTSSWPPTWRWFGLSAIWAVALAWFLNFPCSGIARAADDIVVAAVSTRPGPQLPEGGDVSGAVRAYIEREKRGTLIARPVHVIAYEEDCTAASAEAIAGQIVVQGAHVVIGHLCSAGAIAAAPIYARHGILMITPGARSPRLTDKRAGPGIFRLAGRDDRFGAETATLIAERFATRRIAIVNDLSVQARTLADAVDRGLKARSITPVLRATYISGEREYNAVIDKLATAQADVIVIPAQPVEAGLIIEGLRTRNLHATLIGSEILAVPEMETAARRLGEALIVMLPPAVSGGPVFDRSGGLGGDKRPGPVEMGQRDATADTSYAAIEAWTFAVQRVGSLDIAAVTRILETEQAPTRIGPVRFDVKGDAVLASYAPHTWRTTLPRGQQGTTPSGGWRVLAD